MLVSRFDDCFRFYRNVMGFKVTWGREGEGYASFDAGSITLALFKRDIMAKDVGTMNLPSEAKCQDRVALIFQVKDLKDLKAEAVKLKKQGVKLITEPTKRPDYGIRVIHLRDPDENLIEIFSQMPKEKWTEELREEGKSYSRNQFARSAAKIEKKRGI